MARKKKAQVEEPTSTAVEAEAVPEAPKDDGTVVVALNRAQGIIYRLPGGRTVEIAGNSVHLRGKEMGSLPVGAFGLTVVKKDDWDWISKTYGKTALFRSGRIFASGSKASALAEARDKRETRNGLEPVGTSQTEPGQDEEEA